VKRCKKCGLCCRYIHTYIDNVNFDDEWVEARRGKRIGDDVYLEVVCKYLTKEGLCGIYKKRPQYCREWPMSPEPWILNMGCKFFDG